MKLVYKLGIILLLAGLIATPIADASGNPFGGTKHKYTKTIKKEFPINASGTTSLQNKYGNIEVKTWDRNRVKISIIINVEAIGESYAQEAFDRIHIDFANDQNLVKAATRIEAQKNTWWSSRTDEKTEFSINYMVTIPQSGSLKLVNKYGDAFVETISGSAELNVHYGNFHIEGVRKDLAINMGYAEGTVVKANDIIAEVSNCKKKLRIKEANDVILTSNNSRISIEKGQTIKADSRHDFYTLGNIKKLKFQGRYADVEVASVDDVYASNSRYSDFYIGVLNNSTSLELLDFCGVTIDKISKGFSDVYLQGKHTDFKLTMDSYANFKLDAEAKSAGVTYPKNFKVQSEKDTGISHVVIGQKGSSGGLIQAKFEYGGLRIN